MKKVYLITVPSEQPNNKPLQFVVDDVTLVTNKYPFFMIQSIDYVLE